jgi:cytochrome c peroxidase
VFINGGMPMHRHGFPTKPSSKTYLGNGNYRVEGIKFNMHGEWEMRFNIRMQGGHSDRVVFKVDLRPDTVEASNEWNATELAILNSMIIDNATLPTDLSNSISDNPDAAALGQKLFFDKRFSVNGQVACASCHKPELYFTDGLKTSQGVGTVKRNAPTIVGAGFHSWFFHDGRADSLWSQALGPMEDSQEHGGSRTQYAHLIYKDPAYRKSYEKLFGKMPDLSDKKRFPAQAGPVRDRQLMSAWKAMSEKDRKAVTEVYVNMGKAIAAYERKLKPAPSRFDNYVKAALKNDREQMGKLMTAEEVAGLKLFLGKANCTICHNGPLFTDLGFHNIATPPVDVKRYDYGRKKGITAVKRNPFNCLSEYNDAKDKSCDELKYLKLHKEETMAAFKTPSLRNVTKTAPYMHAGQYQTLAEVLKHYAEPPSTKVGMSDLLPVELNETELKQLEAFLRTLDSPIAADQTLLAPPFQMSVVGK